MTFRLTPQMSAALRAGRSPIVPLVEVVLPTHTIRHLVGAGEVDWNGLRFRGRDPLFGVLVAAGNLQDGIVDEAPEWQLTFAPPDGAVAGDLADATAQGGAVRGWLGVIDRGTGLIVPEPLQLFDGALDVPRVRAGRGTLTVEWRCTSSLEVFHDQEAGARLSDSHHKTVWPEETGLANMSGIERTSYWGTESPPSAVTYGGGSSFGVTAALVQAQQ